MKYLRRKQFEKSFYEEKSNELNVLRMIMMGLIMGAGAYTAYVAYLIIMDIAVTIAH